MRTRCLSVVVVVGIIGCGKSSDPRFDAERVQKMRTTRDKIVRECATLGEHAWAGEYWAPRPANHATLWLAPEAGAVLKSGSDEAPVPDFDNYGSAEEKNGKITIRWQLGEKSISEFLIVRWGEHHYLI